MINFSDSSTNAVVVPFGGLHHTRKVRARLGILILIGLLSPLSAACGDDDPNSPTIDAGAIVDSAASRDSGDGALVGECPEDWQRPFAVDADEYPFTSRCAALAHGLIHYIDEGPAPGQERGTILAVHGNPTWSFLYRKLAKQLIDDGYRFIALDAYGFGMSDKPSLTAFDYRASSHSDTVTAFVQALDLADITLVVQDWGGPVGLGMAVHMPERIRDLLLINTWSWEVERIGAGETSYMHTIHDWGLENIVNEPYYEVSMQTAIRGGNGLGRLNGEADSAEFRAVSDAFWGPFFDLQQSFTPVTPDAVTPVNIFAASLLTDWQFLRNLDRDMAVLYDKPVYFMFGDDTAFGPLKCDVGPVFPKDFAEVPAITITDERPLCPSDYVCTEAEPAPLQADCVDGDGQAYWPILERYLSLWNPNRVVGVFQDAENGHWLQEERPEVAADAVNQLRAFQP